MCCICCRQRLIELLYHHLGVTVVLLVRRKQAKAGMVMPVVVPVEKGATKGLCVFQASKAVRKFRSILERLEMGFRVRVVIVRSRTAMRSCDAETGQELRHHLRRHRRATVGMDGQLLGFDSMFHERSGPPLWTLTT